MKIGDEEPLSGIEPPTLGSRDSGVNHYTVRLVTILHEGRSANYFFFVPVTLLQEF